VSPDKPVSQVEFHNVPSGTTGIANKGNDTGNGQGSNSSGLTWPLSIETNLILTPTSESFYAFTYFDPNGWGGNSTSSYRTQLDIMNSLRDTTSYDPPDPNLNKFQGRQVYESANGTVTDTCYDSVPPALKGSNPTRRAAILGSVWNVGWGWGNGNDYGPDNLGFSTASIDWYRSNIPSFTSCTVSIPQAMTIVNNMSGYSNEQFATHTLSWTITLTSITVTKDGFSQSRSY
jgi:hypothetical protein